MTDASQDRLVAAVRAALDTGVEHMPAADRTALAQARRAALAAAVPAARAGWMAPAAVFATAAAVLIAVGGTPPAVAPSSVDDLELLGSTDDLDLYRDLDFVQWLDRQPSPG
ncbi:MAG: hypothetical protein AB7Q97_10070 [Gammaproteobacteria bacterium]